MKLDLSPEGPGRVVLYTVGGTALCIAAALYVDSFNFVDLDHTDLLHAVVTDIVLPTLLAVPLLLYFSMKLRELAIANQRLAIFALTDGLTGVLNRAAFWTLVESYLADETAPVEQRFGALLVIDADDFKSINDRFGHDRGDEALVAIAGAIRSTLRATDIVGRLGGEEFGVFLPGTVPGDIRTIAERVRRAVANVRFTPEGRPHPLSISVGGTAFSETLPFAELFREADRQLYAAKQAGRNRVEISATPAMPMAASA
jgi:diguanylate cyclase (GGDEF)-like protein